MRLTVLLHALECVEFADPFRQGSVDLVDVGIASDCEVGDVLVHLPEDVSVYDGREPPRGDLVLIDEGQSNTGVEIA